mmetsp:Transcript_103078/g.183151  ORF Transcript_103078/g.183151 Transcript_103078/m.183151 type:complete len:225 (+) Transcript_103078:775-1449(+)
MLVKLGSSHISLREAQKITQVCREAILVVGRVLVLIPCKALSQALSSKQSQGPGLVFIHQARHKASEVARHASDLIPNSLNNPCLNCLALHEGLSQLPQVQSCTLPIFVAIVDNEAKQLQQVVVQFRTLESTKPIPVCHLQEFQGELTSLASEQELLHTGNVPCEHIPHLLRCEPRGLRLCFLRCWHSHRAAQELLHQLLVALSHKEVLTWSHLEAEGSAELEL